MREGSKVIFNPGLPSDDEDSSSRNSVILYRIRSRKMPQKEKQVCYTRSGSHFSLRVLLIERLNDDPILLNVNCGPSGMPGPVLKRKNVHEHPSVSTCDGGSQGKGRWNVSYRFPAAIHVVHVRGGFTFPWQPMPSETTAGEGGGGTFRLIYCLSPNSCRPNLFLVFNPIT